MDIRGLEISHPAEFRIGITKNLRDSVGVVLFLQDKLNNELLSYKVLLQAVG